MKKKVFFVFLLIILGTNTPFNNLSLVSAANAASSLIKSQSNPAVYYLHNGKRYAFPNEKVYFSWYTDFSQVSTVTDSELAAIPLAGNVTYRPGVKMVKITTDPKVYAVAQGGTLRWITNENIAQNLYGSSWATYVEDVPDSFFVNYTTGAAIYDDDDYPRQAEYLAHWSFIPNATPLVLNTPQMPPASPPVSSPPPSESTNQTSNTPINLQSAFLKTDPIIQGILSSNTPLDVGLTKLHSPDGKIDKSSFAYKLTSAFYMLGYGRPDDTQPLNEEMHLYFLHQFQTRNGFPVTNLLSKEGIVTIDAQLIQREQMYAAIAPSFPLLTHLPILAQNEVTKEFITTLFTLPILALPPHLQMKTEAEYIDCIEPQCVGGITNQQGATILNAMPGSNYLFNNVYFVPGTGAYLSAGASTNIHAIIHEYAHYLDGLSNDFYYAKNGTKNQLYPQRASIDTRSFYQISWETTFDISDPHSDCAPRKINEPSNFITKYAYNGSVNLQFVACPAGRFIVAEDFAESFAAYVGNGRLFRAAAAKNTVLAQKYTWLKTHVFNGVEYDTELAVAPTSGCNDTPGYLSCSNDYVWDGTLRKLVP